MKEIAMTRGSTPNEKSRIEARWSKFQQDEGRYVRLNATGRDYCALCGDFVYFQPTEFAGSNTTGAVHGVMGEDGTVDRCDPCYTATAGGEPAPSAVLMYD